MDDTGQQEEEGFSFNENSWMMMMLLPLLFITFKCMSLFWGTTSEGV